MVSPPLLLAMFLLGTAPTEVEGTSVDWLKGEIHAEAESGPCARTGWSTHECFYSGASGAAAIAKINVLFRLRELIITDGCRVSDVLDRDASLTSFILAHVTIAEETVGIDTARAHGTLVFTPAIIRRLRRACDNVETNAAKESTRLPLTMPPDAVLAQALGFRLTYSQFKREP